MSKGTLLKSFIKGFTDNGSGGGNIGTGAYNVKVIDYDGTIIAEKNLNEGDSFTLPKAPSHDGLVFQEWSSSQEIVNGAITVGKSDVMIGAIYTTESGQNEFDIELTTVTGLSVTLNIDGTKDWGDGSTSDTLTSHTYSQAGKYTIKCNGTTITASSSSGLFGQNSSNPNGYCVAIRIANLTTIPAYALPYCFSMKTINFSNTIQEIRGMDNAKVLKCLIVPIGITTIYSNILANAFCCSNVVLPYTIKTVQSGAFQTNIFSNFVFPLGITSVDIAYFFVNCYALKNFNIPENTTIIGATFSSSCRQLIKVVIPTKVTTIKSNAFLNCSAVLEYDFSSLTAVPTLENVNSFSGIHPLCKIKVPSALYDEWIEEANWVTYADYIVAV